MAGLIADRTGTATSVLAVAVCSKVVGDSCLHIVVFHCVSITRHSLSLHSFTMGINLLREVPAGTV